MKFKQLFLLGLFIGAFHSGIAANPDQPSFSNNNEEKRSQEYSDGIEDVSMRLKKDYDFTSIVLDKNGIPLSCGTSSIDINGTACYLSDYPGYEGLFFQTPFTFREAGLCNTNNNNLVWGINNLKKGYKVTLVVKYSEAGGLSLIDNGIAQLIQGNEIESVHNQDTLVYSIKEDGVLAFNAGKWSSYWIKLGSIKIEKPIVMDTTVIDFNNWTGEPLAISTTEAGTAWEIGNKIYQKIYNCTTPGLERFAFQAVTDGSGKGYWIRPSKGGLFDYNATRSMAILNLKEGNKITINSTGLVDFTGGSPTDGTWTLEDSIPNVYVVNMLTDGNLGMCVGKNIYVKDITIISEKADIQAPSISVTGSQDEANTVTITSNTDGANLYYSINNGDAILYTKPFTVDYSCSISSYAELDGDISDKTVSDVIAGYIVKPTSEIIKVNSLSRTIQLSTTTAGASISYSIDNTIFSEYSVPFEINDTTIILAVAKKNDFVSDTLSISIAAGTQITLNAPTYSKVSYNEETGVYVYSISSNTSSVLCMPEVTIKYTLPNGTQGVCSNGGEVTIETLGKLVAIVESEGYLSAESYMWVKSPSILELEWKLDLDTLSGGYDDKFAPILQTEVITKENNVDLVRFAVEDSILPNLAAQSGTTWLLRSGVYSEEEGGGRFGKGLYQFNSGGRTIAITDLKRNQVIKIFVDNIMNGIGQVATTALTYIDNGVGVLDVNLSDDDTLVYRIVSPGNLVFNMARYHNIHYISAYSDPNVTKDVEFSISKCDNEKRYVRIETATSEAEIYYRLGEETSDILTDSFGNDSIVDTTILGEYTLYTEPVEISSNTRIGAYATYQDVASEEIVKSFEAGTIIKLPNPVITYTTEQSQSGSKNFTISVDNSKVTATPTSSLYYILPGQEPKLYEGSITVDASQVGWLTAYSECSGYKTSDLAKRYIDSRESYTETYVVIDKEISSMPTTIGDLEIDYSSDINVSQQASVSVDGRIYLHRVANKGSINVVLPFAMLNSNFTNGKVYVTDANGNILERGKDFWTYKLEADAEPVSEIYTGNLVANTAGYLVKVKTELIGKEIIFVSAPATVTLGLNQSTFTQPDKGYSVKTNRRFEPVILNIPAYLLNEEGTAFELIVPDAEKGIFPIVPPFQACILADEIICSDSENNILSLDVITDVISTNVDAKQIKEVKYFTISGVQLSTPVVGLNIKQIIYVDGTQKVIKIYKK